MRIFVQDQGMRKK